MSVAPILTSDEARKKWRIASQKLEEGRKDLCSSFSIRINSAEDRVDIVGSSYTVYVIEITNLFCPHSCIDHRYSEFARLQKELLANSIYFRSLFPTKSLVGRLGNWTPCSRVAPTMCHELITYRKIKLDIWLVELAEKLSRHGEIVGAIRQTCLEFLENGSASTSPCDRANPVPDQDDINKHASLNAEKYISNPLSFTLGSEIRKATYIVRKMCTSDAFFQDQSIPLDLLHQAWGLCFLTVVKAGFVMSGRFGTGLIIARANGGWSPPSALGTVGMGWGALIGGDITTYLIVLNTKRALMSFAGRNGSVNLGAELGVAVGPLGRGATGNINARLDGQQVAPAYSYAHSKGFFIGASLEGSIVVNRRDINAKFYGRHIDVDDILFGRLARPRAAETLYKALNHASGVSIDGFRPSLVRQKFQPLKLSCNNTDLGSIYPTNNR